jgi:hydroxyethylthiazole kinase
MNPASNRAAENLKEIRERKPLIHNITNFVVMNYTANALLAMGASPVMAHAENEVEDMVVHAGALVLNIGTLTEEWIAAMIKAGKMASRKGIPVILDPVGSGATPFRTEAAKKIIHETSVSVIRGNASEILSLKETHTKTKGVDAIHSLSEAAQSARELAVELKTTIVITGPVDMVTDGNRTLHVSNGHPLMASVTGTGCTATALIGAFLAVERDPVQAAAGALAYFGLAGEVAGEKANAPGTFMIELLNALFTVTPRELAERAKIQ